MARKKTAKRRTKKRATPKTIKVRACALVSITSKGEIQWWVDGHCDMTGRGKPRPDSQLKYSVEEYSSLSLDFTDGDNYHYVFLDAVIPVPEPIVFEERQAEAQVSKTEKGRK